MLEANVVVAERYRLDRLLGEGGMGVVWAATEITTGASFALKFIKEAGMSPERHRRFTREARAAMAITHPHVIHLYEVVAGDPARKIPPFMVMDLLEGETLAHRLARERTLSVVAFADLFVPVVSAVGAAHALGIVHRDLKPENIFLSGGTVSVLDFGIAKLTSLEGDAVQTAGLTETGDLLGTPRYMSPEQVFGESDVDHLTDVWSLGVILFECLSGCPLIGGDNVGQIFKAITAGPIPRLDTVCPTAPASIVEITSRMLARDRNARLRDLREVQAVLRPFTTVEVPSFDAPMIRIAHDRVTSAIGYATTVDDSSDALERRFGLQRGGIGYVAAANASGAESGSVNPSTGRSRRRRAQIRLAIGLIAGAAVLGGGATVLRRRGSDQESKQTSATTPSDDRTSVGSSPSEASSQAASGGAFPSSSPSAAWPAPSPDAGTDKPDAGDAAHPPTPSMPSRPTTVAPSRGAGSSAASAAADHGVAEGAPSAHPGSSKTRVAPTPPF